MYLILGSIVEISHKKMYVNNQFKEEYTFKTDNLQATSEPRRADDPPKPAPPSIAVELIATTRSCDCESEARNYHHFKMAAAA